jgi:hypothetical protein
MTRFTDADLQALARGERLPPEVFDAVMRDREAVRRLYRLMRVEQLFSGEALVPADDDDDDAATVSAPAAHVFTAASRPAVAAAPPPPPGGLLPPSSAAFRLAVSVALRAVLAERCCVGKELFETVCRRLLGETTDRLSPEVRSEFWRAVASEYRTYQRERAESSDDDDDGGGAAAATAPGTDNKYSTVPGVEPPPAEILERERAWRAWSQTHPQRVAVAELRVVAGLTKAEIAAVTGLSPAVVRVECEVIGKP